MRPPFVDYSAEQITVPSRTGPRLGATVAAMVRRDLGEGSILRVPFLLDIVYGLANLLVFLFISRVLHHQGQQLLGSAATYFDFVAVGLAFMVVAQVCCTQVSTHVSEERRNGTLEVLVGSPVSRPAVAVGMAAHPVLVGIARSSIYLIVACTLLGVDAHRADWFGIAVVLLIGGVAVGGLALWLAAFAIAFSHGQAATRAVLVVLGFLSGAYFPTAALPPIPRLLSAGLPTRMAIDGLRAAMSGARWWPDALVLSGGAVVLVAIGTYLFSLAIDRSIGKGTLAHG